MTGKIKTRSGNNVQKTVDSSKGVNHCSEKVQWTKVFMAKVR